jgi:hypothetical protein
MLSQNDIDNARKEARKSVYDLDNLIRRAEEQEKRKPINPKGLLSKNAKFILIIIIFSVISSVFGTLMWTGTLKLMELLK